MQIKIHKLNAPIYSTGLTLWATAIFFSYLSARFDYSKIGVSYFFSSLLPLIAATYFLMNREKKILGTVFLFLSFLISFFINLPIVPNHRYVLFFASILMILPIFVSPKKEEEFFLSQTVRHVRSLTIIVYFFAFLSKLNWDYLDVNKSCAVVFFRHIQSLHGFIPNFPLVDLSVVYGSLLVELLIPVFLLLRFRNAALYLGLVFHFILALDIYKYFTNFSAVMGFLLFVSVGQAALKKFESFSSVTIENVFKTRAKFFLWLLSSLFVLMVTSIVVDFSGGVSESKAILLFVVFRHLMWLIYGSFLLIAAAKLFLESRNVFAREIVVAKNIRFNLLALAVLSLAFINGTTPFVGLKSRTGFNMYGNLRVEPSFSNHLFVPRTLGVSSYMYDVGYVLGADEEMLCDNILYPNTQYPIFEILRAANRCKDQTFEFAYGKSIFKSDSNEVDLLIEQKTSIFTRKLLTFKPIGLKAESECIW